MFQFLRQLLGSGKTMDHQQTSHPKQCHEEDASAPQSYNLRHPQQSGRKNTSEANSTGPEGTSKVKTQVSYILTRTTTPLLPLPHRTVGSSL